MSALQRQLRPQLQNQGEQMTLLDYPKFSARALLVGARSSNQRLQEKFLTDYGIEVEVVTNGLEAAKRVSAQRFDVVFIDFVMPNIDGYFTAALIRKVEHEQSLTAIKLIGMATELTMEKRLRASRAGMDDCMEKPVQATDYIDVLDLYLAPGPGPLEAIGRTESRPMDFGKSDADPVLDSHHLDGLLLLEEAGTQGLILELVECFIANAATSLSQLSASVEREDWRTLWFDAHAFKSNCSSLGLNVLRASAACLEAAAQRQDRTLVEIHLKSLFGHLVPAMIALKTYVQTRKSKS